MTALAEVETQLRGKIKYDIIIDDVLFGSEYLDDLELVLKAFDALCQRFNVTIGTKVDPTNQIVHRGIQFDLELKTQCLKSEFVEKFNTRSEFYKRKPTMERAKSLLGMISHASQVIRIQSLTETHHEVIQALLRGKPNGKEFDAVTLEIDANIPVPMRRCEETPLGGTICADATPSRIAAMYIDVYGNVTTRADDIDMSPIHVAEAKATLLALQLVPPRRVTHTLIVISDNLTWLFSVISPGRITTHDLSGVRNNFYDAMSRLNMLPIFKYIRSAHNPADGMSRNVALDHSNEDIVHMTNTARELNEMLMEMREGH